MTNSATAPWRLALRNPGRGGAGMAERKAAMTFWGVRSGPSPGREATAFGGNSPCIELDFGDRIVVLDAGTGLRVLGQSLMARSPVHGDLLFSYTNFNRICGLPFFAAAFHPENSFTFHCGHPCGEGSIKAELTRLMTDPVFPVPIDIFNAELAFRDFEAGASFDLAPGIGITTLPVTCGRPGTSYRIDGGSWSVAYASTVRPAADMQPLIGFVRGCDVLVMSVIGDFDTETADRMAADAATRAEAGELLITDHPPGVPDDALCRREDAVRRVFPGGRLAREGDRIDLS